MTESSEPTEKPDEAVLLDWVLQSLVSIINESEEADASLGITISANGSVISGDIVPAWRWAQLQGDVVSGSALNELFTAISSHFAPRTDEEPARPEFVNLANARFVASDGFIPRPEGMLWRGRLSQISGWTLGVLGPGS